MNQKVKYSEILQDFANPLLHESDTMDMFMTKLKTAELIWNYCIAKEYQLSSFTMLHDAIECADSKFPEMKVVYNMMIEIKEQHFKQYKNFILKTEYRIKPDGLKTVYVESAEPEFF